MGQIEKVEQPTTHGKQKFFVGCGGRGESESRNCGGELEKYTP